MFLDSLTHWFFMREWCRHPIFAHLQRSEHIMYIESDRCEELVNTRSLGFKSSRSDHRRRNNRGLKLWQICYFPRRNQDYIFQLFSCLSKDFSWHNGSIWHYRGFPEISLQSNTGFGKSTLSGGRIKRKNSFSTLDNSRNIKTDAKNPYFVKMKIL